MDEVREEEVVEVMLLMEGALGPARPMYCSLMAVVWATQAEGSMGRTGSWRGTVKYPLGFGSQHLATTRTIGLMNENRFFVQNIFRHNFMHENVSMVTIPDQMS